MKEVLVIWSLVLFFAVLFCGRMFHTFKTPKRRDNNAR